MKQRVILLLLVALGVSCVSTHPKYKKTAILILKIAVFLLFYAVLAPLYCVDIP